METKLIILKIRFVNVACCKCCVTACVLSTVYTMWCKDQWYADSFVCFWILKYSKQHCTHSVLCKSWKLHCFSPEVSRICRQALFHRGHSRIWNFNMLLLWRRSEPYSELFSGLVVVTWKLCMWVLPILQRETNVVCCVYVPVPD